MEVELKPETIREVRRRPSAISRLAYALNRSENTIRRYLKTNDLALTQGQALDALADELQQPKKQLVKPLSN